MWILVGIDVLGVFVKVVKLFGIGVELSKPLPNLLFGIFRVGLESVLHFLGARWVEEHVVALSGDWVGGTKG